MSRKDRFTTSSNPLIGEGAMKKSILDSELVGSHVERMTVEGSINKSFILFAILLATALVGFAFPNPLFIFGGAIGGLGVVIWASFKREMSPTLAPIYAALEGLFIGAISARYEMMFDGIVMKASLLTFTLLFVMLFLYRTRIIPVTEKFRTAVVMATGAIAIVYILNFVLSFFGIHIPYLHEGGIIGIGISLFIIGIACLNLLLDFDMFEKGEQYALPKHYEWFSAMGLIITVVWIYVEVLRLLAILSSD